MSSSAVSYPALGATRCYWSLLNANLQFLYLDPVMAHHFKEQASLMIGRTLIEFIHPDERDSAERDLHRVVQEQAMHGSVTRVKYLRLSQIRVLLGATVKETFPHAQQVGYDQEYLPCDMVINYVADNLVLCFVHAIIDISPIDNDELFKSQWHWTNWCGTVPFTSEASTQLYGRLFQANLVAPPPPGLPLEQSYNPFRIRDATVPTRVFQILANSPTRKILFSWPTENYNPADYGQLALNITMESPQTSSFPSPAQTNSSTSNGNGSSSLAGAGVPATTAGTIHQQHANGNGVAPSAQKQINQGDADSPYAEVKTSCTRRFKSRQSFVALGVMRTVDSIFVPHGSVIFACHLVVDERPVETLDTGVQDGTTAMQQGQNTLFSHAWELKPHQSPSTMSSSSSNAVVTSLALAPPPMTPSVFHPAMESQHQQQHQLSPAGHMSQHSQSPAGSHTSHHSHADFAFNINNAAMDQNQPTHSASSGSPYQQAWNDPAPNQMSANEVTGAWLASSSIASGSSVGNTGPSISQQLAPPNGFPLAPPAGGAAAPNYLPWQHHQQHASTSSTESSSSFPNGHSVPFSSSNPGPPPITNNSTSPPNFSISPPPLPLPPQNGPTHAQDSLYGMHPEGLYHPQPPQHQVQHSPFTLPPHHQQQLPLPGLASLVPPPSEEGYGDYTSKPRPQPLPLLRPGVPHSGSTDSDVSVSGRRRSPLGGSSSSSPSDANGGGTTFSGASRTAKLSRASSHTHSPVHVSSVNNSGSASGSGSGNANGSGSAGRASGNPPQGVTQCAFCGTTSSPEWRKGTTGIKNLCNACGLRYARTKQKEEGHVPMRRRAPASVSSTVNGASNGLGGGNDASEHRTSPSSSAS